MDAPRSIEKHPIIHPGDYDGLWTANHVVILFDNGSKSAPIKLTQGVRGVNCECKVRVHKDGLVKIM